MNKILKAGLTVGAATILGVSAAGFAGCETSNEARQNSEKIFLRDQYIVLEEKGVYTLHKGDIYFYQGGQWSLSGNPASFEFDCGYNGKDYSGYEEGRMGGTQYNYYPVKPSKNTHDNECKKCFNK